MNTHRSFDIDIHQNASKQSNLIGQSLCSEKRQQSHHHDQKTYILSVKNEEFSKSVSEKFQTKKPNNAKVLTMDFIDDRIKTKNTKQSMDEFYDLTHNNGVETTKVNSREVFKKIIRLIEQERRQ